MALILLQVGATPIAIGIVTKMFEPTVLKKRSDYFNPKKSDTFTIRHRAIIFIALIHCRLKIQLFRALKRHL
jgi:hypothetical protein